MTNNTYAVELEGESYTVDADGELDARYRAASKHKEQMGGPDVGIGVSELANHATATSATENDAA